MQMKCVGARTGVKKAGDFLYEFQPVPGLRVDEIVTMMQVWTEVRKYEIGSVIEFELGVTA
jgi:hypothetical protein